MNLKNDAINKLISGKFEIDCIDINLIQQVEKDPIIHNGSGTIYQDKNGVLNLKLYAEITNKNRMVSHRLKHFVPGKIIGNENYFSLRATDMSGGKWDAENLWLSHNVYDAGQVIRAELREIKNITEADKRITPEKTYLSIVTPGSYQIPCNKKEDLPNGGWRFNKSLFPFNQIDFNK